MTKKKIKEMIAEAIAFLFIITFFSGLTAIIDLIGKLSVSITGTQLTLGQWFCLFLIVSIMRSVCVMFRKSSK